MTALVHPRPTSYSSRRKPLGKRKAVICQVLHSLSVGGAEVLAARIARRLQSDYRFLFVCLDEAGTLGDELRQDGFGVYVLNRRDGFDGRCMRRLAQIVRQEDVGLLHAHQYTPFVYAAGSRWLRSKPPIVFTEHGRHHPDYPRKKRMVANRFLLRREDHVIGVGEAVRRALIANEGIQSDRVQVIYNGINLDPFRGLPDSIRASMRSDLGYSSDDQLIIQVARLDYLKDHLTGIRAFARLQQQLPQARLLLVGEGPQRSRIESEIAAQNCRERVRLLGLRNDVPKLVAAADLFWLTSVSEGIPLTLIEAMASALPVVSTNAGGVAEVVRDGETGMIVPVGDDAALAAAALRLLQDPDLSQRLAKNGRRRAIADFSEDRMLASYERIYEELVHV